MDLYNEASKIHVKTHIPDQYIPVSVVVTPGISYLCVNKFSDIEKKRYICNVVCHWLMSYSTMCRKRA